MGRHFADHCGDDFSSKNRGGSVSAVAQPGKVTSHDANAPRTQPAPWACGDLNDSVNSAATDGPIYDDAGVGTARGSEKLARRRWIEAV
jgi:hypothetical protein